VRVIGLLADGLAAPRFLELWHLRLAQGGHPRLPSQVVHAWRAADRRPAGAEGSWWRIVDHVGALQQWARTPP
jgi:hypothetical protein